MVGTGRVVRVVEGHLTLPTPEVMGLTTDHSRLYACPDCLAYPV
jgi:hypothetical protein